MILTTHPFERINHETFFCRDWYCACLHRGMGLVQHVDRQVRVLHRDRGQPHVVFGVVSHNLGQMVVQEPRQVGGILRLRPIGEHHRNGAHHLDLDARPAVFFDPLLGIPAVGRDFAEEGVVTHHVGEAWPADLEVDEPSVAEFLGPLGHDSGQNVGVAVDLEHGVFVARGVAKITEVLPSFLPNLSTLA